MVGRERVEPDLSRSIAMAKMFYTLDEAAAKLGKSTGEVQGLISSGQLQEFRDRDRIMLKVEQVDLLAGGDEDHIPLAESGELDTIQLADSGEIGIEPAKDQTGISIFDADETDEADPSAVTHVHGGGAIGVDFSTDLSSSGSGLMDLTRESDDTSLGGEALLEDIYAEDADTVDQTFAGEAGAEDLFESTPDADVGVGAPAAVIAADPYDGVWSGIAGGAAFGAIVALCVTIVVVLGALVTGSPAAPAVDMVRDNYTTVFAGLGGVTVVCMIVGFLLGKMSA
jgi:hypothetical protein